MASSYNRSTGTVDSFTTGTLTGTVTGSDHGNKADAINKIEAQIVKEAPLNVKWPEFGAVGNGVADDTSEIQAAIAAAPVGSSVFLPGGVYKLSGSLTLNGVSLVGETPRGLSNMTVLNHTANGNMIVFTGSGKLENLTLYQTAGGWTGSAIHAANLTDTALGYIHADRVNITGDVGWERDMVLDGTLNGTAGGPGLRSSFFTNCQFFGATTVDETVVLKRVVHCFFTNCEVIQAPAVVVPGIKVFHVDSEDVYFSGVKNAGTFYTEAAGGLHYVGRISDAITCAASSARNFFMGLMAGSTWTNSGLANNLRLYSGTNGYLNLDGPLLTTGEVNAGGDVVGSTLRLPTAQTAASAENNSIFRDSADGIMKIKDNGGTTRLLY